MMSESERKEPLKIIIISHTLYVLPIAACLMNLHVSKLKAFSGEGNRTIKCVTSIKMAKFSDKMITIFSIFLSRVLEAYKWKKKSFFVGRRRRWKKRTFEWKIYIYRKWAALRRIFFSIREGQKTIVTIYHSTIRLIIILMLFCVYIPHTIYVFLVFVTALNVMFIDFCSACYWMENEKHNRTSREWEVKKLKEW